tara:strand:- start:399 stop:587 length:189 start_codon:yes stop_codon:yes gene_type:complete
MALLADLIGQINSKKHEIQVSLAEGNAMTWESYQRLVGQHLGLEETLIIINNLLEEERRDVA